MRHLIQHTTHYRYTDPVSYSIQVLRLTPRQDEHQRLLRWHIEAPGLLEEQVDAYGNITHTLTMTQPHDTIELRVTGQIEVSALQAGAVAQEDSRLPIQAYCVPTALTECDDVIRAFVHEALPSGLQTPHDALTLAEAIARRVTYLPDMELGTMSVTAPASQVLAKGCGASHDLVHLFLACARALGQPARYVSGYLHTGAQHMSNHAWADVWWPQQGWISIDVAYRHFTSECHCRLAVARDYESASPIRGVRTGGGQETVLVEMQA